MNDRFEVHCERQLKGSSITDADELKAAITGWCSVSDELKNFLIRTVLQSDEQSIDESIWDAFSALTEWNSDECELLDISYRIGRRNHLVSTRDLEVVDE